MNGYKTSRQFAIPKVILITERMTKRICVRKAPPPPPHERRTVYAGRVYYLGNYKRRRRRLYRIRRLTVRRALLKS